MEESLKMSRFKHSHVMGLIGVCLDSGSAPYIVMPYMANGSLLKYLKRERKNVVLTEDADEDDVMLNKLSLSISNHQCTVVCVGAGDSQETDGHVFPDSHWYGIPGS